MAKTTISIKENTRDQLLKMALEMSVDQNRRVTYDDVIQHLFTRRLISLRQGE